LCDGVPHSTVVTCSLLPCLSLLSLLSPSPLSSLLSPLSSLPLLLLPLLLPVLLLPLLLLPLLLLPLLLLLLLSLVRCSSAVMGSSYLLVLVFVQLLVSFLVLSVLYHTLTGMIFMRGIRVYQDMKGYQWMI